MADISEMLGFSAQSKPTSDVITNMPQYEQQNFTGAEGEMTPVGGSLDNLPELSEESKKTVDSASKPKSALDKLPQAARDELGSDSLKYVDAYAWNRFGTALASKGSGAAIAAMGNAYGSVLAKYTEDEAAWNSKSNVINKATGQQKKNLLKEFDSGDKSTDAIVNSSGGDVKYLEKLSNDLRAQQAPAQQIMAVNSLVDRLRDLETSRQQSLLEASSPGGSSFSKAQGDLFTDSNTGKQYREQGGKLYPIGSRVPVADATVRNMNLQRSSLYDAPAKSLAASQGKAFSETVEQVNEFAKRGSVELENNRNILQILDNNPTITNVLGKPDNAASRALLQGIQNGVRFGNLGSISVDIESAMNAAKTEPERAALRALQQALGGKQFAAVREAGFKGSQSDKEFAAIQSTIAGISDPVNAIKAYILMDTAKQELNVKRREMFNRASNGGKKIISTSEFDEVFDRDYAGPRLEQARNDITKLLGGKVTRPSPGQGSPGSNKAPSGGVDPSKLVW